MDFDAGEKLPKRKPTRLKYFDYGMTGVYFITICTHNRKNILSRIVGEGSPLPNETYKPDLLKCGKIVDYWIQHIAEKYPEISIDCYVIMPNHIHLLISLFSKDGRGDPSPTVTDVVGWLKYNITKEINKIYNKSGVRVFQRSFYDHIVRNRDDYHEIYKYIHENPIRWYFDKLYSEE